MRRDPKTVEWASVRRAGELVGTLRRTEGGTEFAYDGAFLDRRDEKERGIAFHLPYEQKVFATHGGLHSYFAGLLPEGRRLIGLQRRLKLSLDDDFSFIVAVGGNTVGDVTVHAEASAPEPIEPLYRSIEEADFQELFIASVGESEQDLNDASIAGVIEKVSDSVVAVAVPRLGPYILKLQPSDLPLLVQNEHFYMQLARSVGLPVAKTAVRQDRNGRSALLVSRFDRIGRSASPLHTEDGCQFLNLLPRDKYRADARAICEGIMRWATAPQVEVLSFLRLYAFSYLIGNGDLHAKNVSLLRRPDGIVALAPAYDLLSTMPYPGYDQRMAIQLDGRDDRFRVRQFADFAARYGLRPEGVERNLRQLADKVGAMMQGMESIGFEGNTNERVLATQRQRLKRFVGDGSD